MLSETITRAPLLSLISLTCEPPFPIIIDASWVTIKHRIWIVAEGAAVAEDEEDCSEELVASPSLASVGLLDCCPGVEEASRLSSVFIVTSFVAAGRKAEPVAVFAGESSEVDAAPVLALLCCFCWSLSEGDRDRLRLESASGIANSV